jgi:hypothetical protein
MRHGLRQYLRGKACQLPVYPDFIAAFVAGLKGGPVPPGITSCAPDEVERRFAVYRNNVAHSLTEALARRFPVIKRLVGDDFFAAMARIYAEDHRPESPVLLAWGESFAGFLATFPPLAAYPYMPDVARIEYARGVAFHAKDVRPAAPEHFTGQNPADLHLRLHPAVQVLRLDHPAVSIWKQNQPGVAAQAITHARPEIGLVLRDLAFDVPVHAISEGDAVMIDQMQAGASLMVAAEMAQQAEPGHDPQPLIRCLMQAGAIVEPKEDI